MEFREVLISGSERPPGIWASPSRSLTRSRPDHLSSTTMDVSESRFIMVFYLAFQNFALDVFSPRCSGFPFFPPDLVFFLFFLFIINTLSPTSLHSNLFSSLFCFLFSFGSGDLPLKFYERKPLLLSFAL